MSRYDEIYKEMVSPKGGSQNSKCDSQIGMYLQDLR